MAKGFGLVLPIERGKTGYFNQSFTILDQAKSNLANLLLTKKGERVMQPNFGCDIHGRIFEPGDDTFVSDVTADIENAAAEWLKYVKITNVDVTYEKDRNIFHAKVEFSLINNPSVNDVIVVSF